MAARPDLALVLAHNLKFFMSRTDDYQNANALGVAAGVSPNFVRYLLDPKKRTTTTEKPQGSPTLDKLDAIAGKLGCQVWELLHPNVERSFHEREMYGKIEQDFVDRMKATTPQGPASRWPAVPVGGARKK